MTHVKLMGEMGEKFGAEWNMDVSNFRDVFRLIDCQTNGFKQYLTTCAEEGINFTIQNGEDLVDGTLDAMIAPVKDTVVITSESSLFVECDFEFGFTREISSHLFHFFI